MSGKVFNRCVKLIMAWLLATLLILIFLPAQTMAEAETSLEIQEIGPNTYFIRHIYDSESYRHIQSFELDIQPSYGLTVIPKPWSLAIDGDTDIDFEEVMKLDLPYISGGIHFFMVSSWDDFVLDFHETTMDKSKYVQNIAPASLRKKGSRDFIHNNYEVQGNVGLVDLYHAQGYLRAMDNGYLKAFEKYRDEYYSVNDKGEFVLENAYNSQREIPPFSELVLRIKAESTENVNAAEVFFSHVEIKNYTMDFFAGNMRKNEPFEIKITEKRIEDGIVKISGTVVSQSAVIEYSMARVKGGQPRTGFIALQENRFEASCPIEAGEENIFRISMSNVDGQSAGMDVVMNTSGGLTEGSQEDKSTGRSRRTYPASGNAGTTRVPPPNNTAQAVAAIVIPGIIAGVCTGLGNLPGTGTDDPAGQMQPSLGPKDGDTMILTDNVNNRIYEIRYDETEGVWINIQDNTIMDPNRFKQWQQELMREKEWNDDQFRRVATRDTLTDRENDEAMHQMKIIKSIQSGKLFERQGLFSEDEIDRMRQSADQWLKTFSQTGKSNKEQYDRITQVIRSRHLGDSLNEKRLPEYDESMVEIFQNTASSMAYEIANGKSKKAIALKILISAATGHFVGKTAVSAVQMTYAGLSSLYSMKDYVDKGGDSILDAFNSAVGNLLVSEAFGRVVGGILHGTVSVTAPIIGDMGKWFAGKFPDVTKKLGDALSLAYKKANTDISELFGSSKPINAAGKNTNTALQDALNRQKYYEKLSAQSNAAKMSARQKAAAVTGKQETGSLRDKAYHQGFEKGMAKVKQLEKAQKAFEADPKSLKAKQDYMDAVKDVQSDKHAQKALSTLEGQEGNQIRVGFNDQMEKAYQTTDANVTKRLAKEYGVDPTQIKTVNPTNKSTGGVDTVDPKGFASNKGPNTSPHDYGVSRVPDDQFKSINRDRMRYDRDVTVRINTGEGYVDVPKKELERIYNEEFYKTMNNSKLPSKRVDIVETINGKNVRSYRNEIDYDEINSFAKKMDQAVTDRLDAEAYGNSDLDLNVALNENFRKYRFTDAEGVAKTMQYKSDEWFKMAEGLREEAQKMEKLGYPQKALELYQQAEGYTAESYRQITKQFSNLVDARVNMLNEIKNFPPGGVANVPQKLREAVEVLKLVESGDVTPFQAEGILREMGYTAQKVANESSAVIEGLQKLNPDAFLTYGS